MPQLQVFRNTGRNGTVAVDDAGRWLVTGGLANTARLWDLSADKLALELAGHDAEVTAAAFAPGGRLFATGDDRGEIRVWRFTSGQAELAATLRGHSRSITALEFNPTGNRLHSASGDNTCAEWDIASASELTDRVLKHPDWVAAMDVSADGSFGVSACEDGGVRVWNLANAQVAAEARFGDGSATGVGFSPDGKRSGHHIGRKPRHVDLEVASAAPD